MSEISYYFMVLPSLQATYKTMNFYCTIFILFPAWVLNFVTACVFMRKQFWKNSTMGYYYTVYPLTCNLVVTIGILNFFPAAFKHIYRRVLVSDYLVFQAIFRRWYCLGFRRWQSSERALSEKVCLAYKTIELDKSHNHNLHMYCFICRHTTISVFHL